MNTDAIIYKIEEQIIGLESELVFWGEQRDEHIRIIYGIEQDLKRIQRQIEGLQQMRKQFERPHPHPGGREVVQFNDYEEMRLRKIRDLAGQTP